uniref:Uncharacterized protein n=1 Tax=Tetraselmis sp. GSL018 TaxID=582737 RepID=A0A061QIQ0_9CHLO
MACRNFLVTDAIAEVQGKELVPHHLLPNGLRVVKDFEYLCLPPLP